MMLVSFILTEPIKCRGLTKKNNCTTPAKLVAIITLNKKLKISSLKEHQTLCSFVALLIVIVMLPLNFLRLFSIWMGNYFHYVELIMSGSKTKVMPSGRN